MTPLATIAAELERPPDAYGDAQMRVFARELLAEVQRLRAENAQLRAINESLAERAARAAELLGKLARRERLCCKKCGFPWEA